MQASDSSENFQQEVLSELKQINQRLDRLETEVEKIDYKFDTYQKASDQVVRLATTIVVAAASVVVLTPVFQAVGPLINAFVSGAISGSS
ncbi:MAG: hypothetical protein HC866_18850 [Leptolyngbyaceae cyanobacterium RU_5_1]|nr:hypothetical protein [Leptolyngbyaceae cyanobacterium RU_5_1]